MGAVGSGAGPVAAGGVKENALQRLIVAKARRMHWLVAHFHTVEAVIPNTGGRTHWITPVAADGKGFPDLILLRDRILVVEVKGTGGKLRPDQIKWLSAFRLVPGVEVHVWSPKEWEAGTVEEVLTRRGGEA